MQIIVTADGSHTLYSPQFDEIYHSRHGALRESEHVFIQAGLAHFIQTKPGTQPVRILEIGLGTGLNALLSMLYAEKHALQMEYDAIERYPVPIETIKELNYTTQLGYEFCYGPYHSLHLCRWNESHPITPHFQFKKMLGDVNDSSIELSAADIIYFDAFAPQHQPEMWTEDVFKRMYALLKPGGILVTYCSKSIVQRAMKQAGFNIEKLPGPPGKREMLRAGK